MAVLLHAMEDEELFDSLIEVKVDSTDDFLKIRETLTRMGIFGKAKDGDDRPTLYQSCHILHKKGFYYIVHFKEMFGIDGREVTMSDEDYARRNTIANTLQKWDMCQIINPEVCESPVFAGGGSLGIIKHSEKKKYRLEAKYNIGNR